MLVRGLISLVLVILTGYALFEVTPLIRGPQLTLDTPLYSTATDGYFTVSGTAVHTQSLFLNGAPLLMDEEGRFSRLMLLPRGGAILTLEASDRFGRVISEQLAVTVP